MIPIIVSYMEQFLFWKCVEGHFRVYNVKAYGVSSLGIIFSSHRTICQWFPWGLRSLRTIWNVEGDAVEGKVKQRKIVGIGDFLIFFKQENVLKSFFSMLTSAQHLAHNNCKNQRKWNNSHQEVGGEKHWQEMSSICNVISPSLKLLPYRLPFLNSETWSSQVCVEHS